MAGDMAGSRLLAALHASMERFKILARIRRALAKKPQIRNTIDISYISKETEKVPLLIKDGPGVHRDLCHVARLFSLSELESFRLPGEFKNGTVFFYVLQGKVQVRCANPEPYNSAARTKVQLHDDSGMDMDDTDEEEMLALFQSIDVDGSGAIDVEELQSALELLGVHKSLDEMQELMDGVDKDGSGELEFEEFKLILEKLLRPLPTETEWNYNGGQWIKEVMPGGSFGEASMLQGIGMEGLIVAREDTSLMVLDKADHDHILENGFDGEVKKKVELIRSSGMFAAALSRSDIRVLAYSMASDRFVMNSVLYEQGQTPQCLYLIIQGECKLVKKMAMERQSSFQVPIWEPMRDESGANSMKDVRAMLRKMSLRRPVNMRRVEVALLGPGDICGEAVLTDDEKHTNSAVVISQELHTIRVERRDLKRLIHPSDIEALKEHVQERESERETRIAQANAAAAAMNESLHRAPSRRLDSTAERSSTSISSRQINARLHALSALSEVHQCLTARSTIEEQNVPAPAAPLAAVPVLERDMSLHDMHTGSTMRISHDSHNSQDVLRSPSPLPSPRATASPQRPLSPSHGQHTPQNWLVQTPQPPPIPVGLSRLNQLPCPDGSFMGGRYAALFGRMPKSHLLPAPLSPTSMTKVELVEDQQQGLIQAAFDDTMEAAAVAATAASWSGSLKALHTPKSRAMAAVNEQHQLALLMTDEVLNRVKRSTQKAGSSGLTPLRLTMSSQPSADPLACNPGLASLPPPPVHAPSKRGPPVHKLHRGPESADFGDADLEPPTSLKQVLAKIAHTIQAKRLREMGLKGALPPAEVEKPRRRTPRFGGHSTTRARSTSPTRNNFGGGFQMGCPP